MSRITYLPAYLDPELAQVAAQIPPVDNSDVAQARQHIAMMHQFMPPVDTGGIDITDRIIPGTERDIPIRIYQPNTPGQIVPTMLFYHWGGFMLGNLETEHARCVMIAREAECVVVSVDYRLAPEHPFPAGVEDCYAGLVWVATNADELGIDPDRIAVGGTSAGGGLAAAVALMARDRQGPKITFQFMGFPVTDDRMETASVKSFTNTPNWNYGATVNMWKYYLGEHSTDKVSPYAAPMRAKDVSLLPPAYVWTAEFDPLRDEGIAYALRLMAAGVPVELHNYAYTFHGFDQVPGAAIARRAQQEQIAVIRAAFGAQPRKCQQIGMPTFSHTMIHVADVAQTVAWYNNVFDLKTKFITEDSQYAELLTGNTTLALSANALEHSKYGDFAENSLGELPPGFHIAISVPNLQTTYQKALESGAVNINPPEAQPWGGRVARIRDVNGVLVAIGEL
ncbi:MAG: alpha/beta hydrolase fold domain-containing protein [Chloroflexota bacterium]